jgi:hypothetical protein
VPPTTTAAHFNLTTRAASDRLMSLHGEIDWISEGIALACLCLFWSCDPSFCHLVPLAASELHIHCPAWNHPLTSIWRSKAGRPASPSHPPVTSVSTALSSLNYSGPASSWRSSSPAAGPFCNVKTIPRRLNSKISHKPIPGSSLSYIR